MLSVSSSISIVLIILVFLGLVDNVDPYAIGAIFPGEGGIRYVQDRQDQQEI
jgi:hypothetical protein